MCCSDDCLFSESYEAEDFRCVVGCRGDQEGVGAGGDDYAFDVGCVEVLLRFDHGGCGVDDDGCSACGEWGDDGLACGACCFFGYELGLLFGVEFSAAVYDEAEGEE